MESQQAKKPNSVATFVCVSIDLTFPFSLILQHTLTVIASSASRVGTRLNSALYGYFKKWAELKPWIT